MRFIPTRIKHRKYQRGTTKGKAQRGNRVAFGEYGLQALEKGRIKSRQLEAGRIALAKAIGQRGNFWIRVFPHKPYTATAAETRMGKGKGEPDYYAVDAKEGLIIYEVGGIDKETAVEAFNITSHKLPIRCKLAERSGYKD